MTRVQIPAYTDRWMRGDRYGEVVGTHKSKDRKTGAEIEVAVVELDSGKTVRVIYADCTEVG